MTDEKKYDGGGGMSTRFIQSFIGNRWMVSTIHRESSVSIVPPPWFFETIVWELDPKTGERGEQHYETIDTNCESKALEHHFSVCCKYMKDSK